MYHEIPWKLPFSWEKFIEGRWNNRLSLSMNNKSTLLNLNPPLYFTSSKQIRFFKHFSYYSFFFLSLFSFVRYYIYSLKKLEEFFWLFPMKNFLEPSSSSSLFVIYFLSTLKNLWKCEKGEFWIFYFFILLLRVP